MWREEIVKRITKIVVVIMFVSILVIPLASTNRELGAVSTTDNRKLAINPIKAALQGTRFANAVDDYFNDRIGFRKEFIDLNGRISYKVFKESPIEKVIVGKNGWLFYDSEKADSGKAISQYLGTHKYTEEQLQTIRDNLLKAKSYLAKKDCEFVLYIAPNKERVYSKSMPDIYQDSRKSETCGTEQIIEYLRESKDITVVWPYKNLTSYMEKYPDEPLYYKLDTHWNMLGGYIGAKALLDEIDCNYKIPGADEVEHTRLETINSGDLRNMMAIGDWLSMEDMEWKIHGFPSDDTIIKEESFNGHWKYYNENKDSRKLLMVRDSFTTAMRSVLGSAFNEADLCHASSYTPDLIEKVKPDIFVYEVVERNVDKLLRLDIIPAK